VTNVGEDFCLGVVGACGGAHFLWGDAAVALGAQNQQWRAHPVRVGQVEKHHVECGPSALFGLRSLRIASDQRFGCVWTEEHRADALKLVDAGQRFARDDGFRGEPRMPCRLAQQEFSSA
jgi:hypothetical protein